MQENGLDALVFELHNVFLADELEENGENHHINYQVWFYETGVMEVRFGDIDLENCSYYFPGLGFSSDNENPEGEIYGPRLGINNDDLTDLAYFEGDHVNPGLVYDESDFTSVVVTSVPNEGFVVRFSPNDVSVEEDVQVSNLFSITQSASQLFIQGEMNKFISFELYDLTGKMILKTDKNVIETTGLAKQLVIVKIISEDGEEIYRVVL